MTRQKFTKEQRHQVILGEIRTSAAIRISSLARRLGVAGETIRRDLLELNKAGLLKRTYGGATLSPLAAEPSIAERGLRFAEERARIGRAAAELVGSGETVMIDGGSTTHQVAVGLAERARDLVIITNSLSIASVAGNNPTFRVILCPGAFDRREASVMGEDTVEFIGRYNADTVIIGASGLTAEGPFDAISSAASVKRAMLARGNVSMLVLDQSKFGRASLARVCDFRSLDHLVSDGEPPAEILSALEKAGTQLHRA